ncbi:hypothetical protein HKD37_03G006977 [Glycine soja]
MPLMLSAAECEEARECRGADKHTIETEMLRDEKLQRFGCQGVFALSASKLGLARKRWRLAQDGIKEEEGTCNTFPERNVVIYHTEFNDFKEELERRNWHEELTSFAEGSIDVAIVKEFYANLYDPEDKSPKQEGETPSAYSEFALLRLDPQELVAKLCIPGRGFELNVDGLPLKILKKNLTTIAQTWSLLSFSNLVPTSHPSDITLDRAKLIYGIIQRMDMNVGYLISHQISMIAHHDSSRLGFPALITALCKAKGVTFDSRTLESLSPAINLAYEKKNYWNLDDLTVTFRGPRKAKGKKSETLPSYKVPPTTSAPASSTPATSTPSKVDISFHDIHFI